MYTLVEKEKGDKDRFIITIKADSNDADYITETTYLNEKDFIEAIPELVDMIENYSKAHMFEDFSADYFDVPYSDNGSCHSLEDWSIEYIDKDGKIFDVKINELKRR